MIFHLRIVLNLHFRSLAFRLSIVELPGFVGVRALKVDVRSVFHNGLNLPECGHGGRSGMFWHGTANLHGIVANNGVLTDAVRTLRGIQGFWTALDPRVAMQYASEWQVDNHTWRCLLHIESRCANRGRAGQPAYYVTRSGCLRYTIDTIYLVPAESVRDVAINVRQ